MNKNLLSIAIFSAAIFVWQFIPTTITSAKAETEVHDDHSHDEMKSNGHDDGHGHESAHDNNDGDDHNDDHSEEGDNHDEHGHDSHKKEDSHDNHGHGDDSHGDEHEEGKTVITPDAAKKAGIVIEKTSSAMIAKIVPLTGRITMDQNAKADVRGRFSGIVRSVKVSLGDQVQKGQILAVVESNESLNNYNVTAPIDGTILERNTNLGDVVNDQPLFIIADLSSVWAKFHIFPKDAEMVNVGQTVRVHTLDEGKENNVAIKMLFPTADALSQTLIAVAPIGNEKNMWRPGMTVEGDVSVSEKKVPLAVRESALQTMEDQTVVFVQEGDKYEMKPVKTGVSDGRYIEITSGLVEGQSYVSEGSFVIKADILKSGAAHEH